MSNSSNSILTLALIALAAIILGLFAQQWQKKSSEITSLEFKNTILLPTPKSLPTAEFVSHLSKPFGSADFAGQWQVLFFGFTHCPDICPTTLYSLQQAKQKLIANGQWGDIGVTMISVDPQRDTPTRLAQYVPHFDEEFTGLTADLETLTEFAKSVGVLFIARDQDQKGNYDVDHSAALILLNPAGQYAGVIPAPHSVEDLVHDLGKLGELGATTKQNALPNDVPNAVLKSAASLAISDAWIRPAPPGADAMAAYLTVTNNGQNTISIKGASSPMFEEVMIHVTTIEDGIASMDSIDELIVEPGKRVTFAPMATHLMLMEPVSSIAKNNLVPITLHLSDGSNVQQIFTVAEPNQP